MHQPTDGEAYDTELSGRRVRMHKDGRTGYVRGQACSCSRPYDIVRDDSGDEIDASMLDFDVIDEPYAPRSISPWWLAKPLSWGNTANWRSKCVGLCIQGV